MKLGFLFLLPKRPPMAILRYLLISFSLCFATPSFAQDSTPYTLPDNIRSENKLDNFYQKYTNALGLPVIGSKNVSNNALDEAAWIVKQMLGHRKDILQAMKDTKVRIAVMAANEYTTDVPEHSKLTPKLFWDRRARGLGATPSSPAVSCGEENLLGFNRDPYPNENIFIHEFAHAIHGTGLNKTDPTFDPRLRLAFQSAIDRGLWKNTYAATNHSEYWAEGVQCWFDDNAPPDALHNDIRTREKLIAYDPTLAALCKEVFDDFKWRYQRPRNRQPIDLAHLTAFDPTKLPKFQWRNTPLGESPKATIQTDLGDFDVVLDSKTAPQATSLFLSIALDGGYHSGQFHLGHVHDKNLKSGWIGARTNNSWNTKQATDADIKKIPPSKVPPTAGTIALLQDDSNPGAFVIFLGSPPVDNLNFIPFGKVIKNPDILTKIFASPSKADAFIKPIDIKRVIRTE